MNPLNYNFGLDRANPEHINKLKKVLALQGTKRWRAASDLYLYLNPVSHVQDEDTGELLQTVSAREAHQMCKQEATDLRKEIAFHGNEHATSDDKNSGRRWGLHMPPGELQFIEMIDPDVLGGTPQERKDSLKKLVQEFKEYAIYK